MRTPKLHPNRITPNVTRPFMDRIRVTRLAKGISQTTAARRLGMDRAAWANVENGVITSPSLDTVHAMASAVGLALDLVPEDAPPPEYLPPLDEEQVRALALLCVWYAQQSAGTDKPLALESALTIMARYADRPPMKQVVPRAPRHPMGDPA